MSNFFKDAIIFLHNLGVFTHLLPFVLIYTILFGLLERVKIFGDHASNYNVVFSFCLAFFTVYNLKIVDGMPILIIRFAIILIVFVVIRLIIGLVGLDEVFDYNISKIVILISLSLYLAYSVIDAFFDFSKIANWFETNNLFRFFGSAGVVVIIFLVLILYITNSSSSSSNTKTTSRSNTAGGGKKGIESPPKKRPTESTVQPNSNPQKSNDNRINPKILDRDFITEDDLDFQNDF